MKQIIAATAVGLLLLTSCASHDNKAADGPTTAPITPSSTTATTPTPSPTVAPTTTAPPTIIDYETGDEDGIHMTKPSDTSKLTGAPADFTAFIAAELAKDKAKSDDVCTEKPQIYVNKIDPKGWAAGGHFIPQCGGYATLWAKVSGGWKQVWAGQTLTDCKTLKKYAFPAAIAEKTCLQGDDEIAYVP
jgi:hypothetical protein